jgi:hypothetical protein
MRETVVRRSNCTFGGQLREKTLCMFNVNKFPTRFMASWCVIKLVQGQT